MLPIMNHKFNLEAPFPIFHNYVKCQQHCKNGHVLCSNIK